MDYHVEVNEALSDLSKKENEVYRLAAEGRLRPAIAKLLHRSPGTINTHFNHILQKLNAENIQQAIAVGFIKGILVCRDKLPAVAMVIGTAFTTAYGVVPSKVYAQLLEPQAMQQEDDEQAPADQRDDKYPMQRTRLRGGSNRQTNPNATRLNGRVRRREDG